MLCDRFSDYMIDAGSSILEVRERERGYLPKPEITPETFDTADLFPDPNDNNSRGAWIVGVDAEVLEKRTKEIEAEEKLNPPKKPFQKKTDPEAEGAEPEADANSDTENNSEDENDDPPADDNVGDDDAEKAGEDILNIDEEVGDKDSGEETEEQPKKKSSFSDMWRKNKSEDADAEASEE